MMIMMLTRIALIGSTTVFGYTWSKASGMTARVNSQGESRLMAGVELPPLPYDYTALEPHIGEKTLRIHHDKHHAKVNL